MSNKKAVIIFDVETGQISEFESISDFHTQINYNRGNLTDNFILNKYICFEKEKLLKNCVKNINYISLPKRYIHTLCKPIIDKTKQDILNKIYDTYVERPIYVYDINNELLGEFKTCKEVATFLNISEGTVNSRIFRNKTNDNYIKNTLITYRKK